MAKFDSAYAAFQWAVEIVIIRRGGRSSMGNMELLYGGGSQRDFAYLDAIVILREADRACSNACPYFSPTCIVDWVMPSPHHETVRLSESETQRVRNCMVEFEERLRVLGFLEG